MLKDFFKRIAAELVQKIIEVFLGNLARAQGMPPGASALTGPEFDKAKAQTVDEVNKLF